MNPLILAKISIGIPLEPPFAAVNEFAVWRISKSGSMRLGKNLMEPKIALSFIWRFYKVLAGVLVAGATGVSAELSAAAIYKNVIANKTRNTTPATISSVKVVDWEAGSVWSRSDKARASTRPIPPLSL